jgi:uncharacterized protein (DUF1499 family)
MQMKDYLPRPRYNYLFIIFCYGLVSVSCAAEKPASPGMSEAGMRTCPDSPNCVSSEDQNRKHHIAPLMFSIPAEEAWLLLKEQVAKLPRTIVVSEKPGYLHVECRSAVFGFVDDLEFHMQAEQGVIAVRSAARTGYYDFGVNRQRVEELRTALLQAGLSP